MYARETIQLHSVAPDLIPQDAAATSWNSANNVAFKNGETVRANGERATLPGATTGARTATYLISNSIGYWAYSTVDGIYAHDGTTEYDITPAAGWDGSADGVIYTSVAFNGFVVFNASDRFPVAWNGDPAQVATPLEGWGTWTCNAIRGHKNFLFALGMEPEGQSRVRWSDAAEAGTLPTEWVAAAGNLAGFVDLAPYNSPIWDGETLRDSFLIYKGEAIWTADFIGGNDVFRFRQLFHEHGIAATNAVTRGIDDVHLFVSSEGSVNITDGVQVSDVLDGRAARFFYSDFADNEGFQFGAVTLAREKSALIAYPSKNGTALDRALVYDFTSRDIGFRDLTPTYCVTEGGELINNPDAATWATVTGTWTDIQGSWQNFGTRADRSLDDVLIGGDYGFALLTGGQSGDFLGGPVSANATKEGLSFGDAQRRKMIARLWPKVTGQPGDVLTFRVGGQEITGGPIAWTALQEFTIGADEYIDCFIQGRFMAIEVRSEGGSQWTLGTMDVEFRGAGKW